MPFVPNLPAQLMHKTGRDVHGVPVYAAPIAVIIAVVNAKRKTEKTSVRADSSGSRGAADQITTGLGRVLFTANETVSIDDRLEFDGDSYRITTVHRRRDIFGELDHIECDIEVLPR